MAALRPSISQYVAELARRGASEHTLRNYASDLEQFAGYFEPPGMTAPEGDQIELPLLREWLSSLYDRQLAPASLRRKLAAVRALFQFLLAEGVIQKNAAARLRTPRS